MVEDGLPDTVFTTYDKMLRSFVASAEVYEYVQVEGIWRYARTHTLVEDELCYHSNSCPDMYKTYVFPNMCDVCKNDKYMISTYCMLCNDKTCLDCGKENCRCHLSDY